MNELEILLDHNWLSIYDGVSIEEYEAIDEIEEIHEVSYE